MSILLLIGEHEVAALLQAVERARKHPLPWDIGRQIALEPEHGEVKLSDRRNPEVQRKHVPQKVLIPMGFRVAIGFEEQPAGIYIHLSVSVGEGERLPNIPSVKMITEICGVDLDAADRIWVEEFAPGRHAVNVIKLIEERQGGHA